MLGAAWLVLLGLLALGYDGWLGRLYNPNQDVAHETGAGGERIVRLVANRNHQFLSSGTLLDQPVVFIVDTGASDVVVPAALARELGLEGRGGYIARTANGDIRVTATTIPRLSLGAIELRDVPAAINPGMAGREVLLGMSAMRELEIRKSGDTLTLVQ